MIKPTKAVLFYLIGAAMIGILAACGEQQQEPQPEKKTPLQAVKKPQKKSGDILARPTYAPPPRSGSSFASTTPAETTQQAEVPREEVEADTLQPISAEEASARTEIRKSKRSTWQLQTAIPAGSVADQIQKSVKSAGDSRYVWTPQPVQESLELFRVPDIKLSPDSSLLIFVETIGEARGPFGTRLIMMSTGNWQILNILEFRERFFRKIAFVPGTTKIAALCIEQPECAQKQGFACIDLLTGKEERFQQIDPGIGDTAFLVDNNQNLIVSHPKREVLIILPLASKDHREISVCASNAIATISPDGKEIAVLKPQQGKIIEVFRTADWLPSATVDLADTTNVAGFHFARGNKSFFLCGDPSFSAGSVFVRAGKTTTLDGVSSGKVIFKNNGKKIYHLTETGNEIQVIDGVSGAQLRTIEVNKAEPGFRRSRPGKVTHLFYIPACDGLAMFDNKGNFFLVPAEPQESSRGKNDERAIIFQGQFDD